LLVSYLNRILDTLIELIQYKAKYIQSQDAGNHISFVVSETLRAVKRA